MTHGNLAAYELLEADTAMLQNMIAVSMILINSLLQNEKDLRNISPQLPQSSSGIDVSHQGLILCQISTVTMTYFCEVLADKSVCLNIGNDTPWSLWVLYFQTQRSDLWYFWNTSPGVGFRDTHTKQHLPRRGCPAWLSCVMEPPTKKVCNISGGDALVIRCQPTWMMIRCHKLDSSPPAMAKIPCPKWLFPKHDEPGSSKEQNILPVCDFWSFQQNMPAWFVLFDNCPLPTKRARSIVSGSGFVTPNSKSRSAMENVCRRTAQHKFQSVGNRSPLEFPLRFEGAWATYEAEKSSCFIQKNGVGSPDIVDT